MQRKVEIIRDNVRADWQYHLFEGQGECGNGEISWLRKHSFRAWGSLATGIVDNWMLAGRVESRFL